MQNLVGLSKKIEKNFRYYASVLINGQHAGGFALWFAELFMAHPLMIKRTGAIVEFKRKNPGLKDDSDIVIPKEAFAPKTDLGKETMR